MSEPILAWRVWRLDDRGYLRSLTWRSFSWAPLKVSQADLISASFKNCGIHGFKKKEDCLRLYHATNKFIVSTDCFCYGQVSLWGRVIEHERGYRAQYAYPYEIFVPSSTMAKHLTNKYAVDVFYEPLKEVDIGTQQYRSDPSI